MDLPARGFRGHDSAPNRQGRTDIRLHRQEYIRAGTEVKRKGEDSRGQGIKGSSAQVVIADSLRTAACGWRPGATLTGRPVRRTGLRTTGCRRHPFVRDTRGLPADVVDLLLRRHAADLLAHTVASRPHELNGVKAFTLLHSRTSAWNHRQTIGELLQSVKSGKERNRARGW